MAMVAEDLAMAVDLVMVEDLAMATLVGAMAVDVAKMIFADARVEQVLVKDIILVMKIWIHKKLKLTCVHSSCTQVLFCSKILLKSKLNNKLNQF